jgi:hypothetical protein
MTDKVLSEFAIKLNKSRTQLTDVCNQVENMTKEANLLQGELRGAHESKDAEIRK